MKVCLLSNNSKCMAHNEVKFIPQPVSPWGERHGPISYDQEQKHDEYHPGLVATVISLLPLLQGM